MFPVRVRQRGLESLQLLLQKRSPQVIWHSPCNGETDAGQFVQRCHWQAPTNFHKHIVRKCQKYVYPLDSALFWFWSVRLEFLTPILLFLLNEGRVLALGNWDAKGQTSVRSHHRGKPFAAAANFSCAAPAASRSCGATA
mmetsp:Transcript_10287/g.22321  ORF Transcript_10287/g.22321 Transcript_10287/m.22321 type:complete len:140 (-) Transcript_10287:34-453(-)|eukprot:4761292-Pleurochrysis_carterae.AAC.1